jgi:hypothetical protein
VADLLQGLIGMSRGFFFKCASANRKKTAGVRVGIPLQRIQARNQGEFIVNAAEARFNQEIVETWLSSTNAA